MKLSKKQAKLIASLVNGATCWYGEVKEQVSKPDSEYDSKKVRQAMAFHDSYARQLNELLGVTALHTYDMEAL